MIMDGMSTIIMLCFCDHRIGSIGTHSSFYIITQLSKSDKLAQLP